MKNLKKLMLTAMLALTMLVCNIAVVSVLSCSEDDDDDNTAMMIAVANSTHKKSNTGNTNNSGSSSNTNNTNNTAGITSIELNKNAATIKIGGTEKLTATVNTSYNYSGDKSVTWSTSDSTIAQVSNDVRMAGTVTALKTGTATITATAGDKTATCTVTVLSNVLNEIVNETVTLEAGATCVKVLHNEASSDYTDKNYSVDLSVAQTDSGVKAYVMSKSQYDAFVSSMTNITYTNSTLSCPCKVKSFSAMDSLASNTTYYYVVYNPNGTGSQSVTLKIEQIDKITDTDTLFKATNAVTIDGGDYLAIKLDSSSSYQGYAVDLTASSGVEAYVMDSSDFTSFKSSKTSISYTDSALSCPNKVTKFSAEDKLYSSYSTYYVVYNPNLTSQTLSLSLKKVDYTKIDTDTLFKATNAVTIDGGDYLAIKLDIDSYSYQGYAVDLTASSGVEAYVMSSSNFTSFKSSKTSISYTDSALSCPNKVTKFSAEDKLYYTSYYYVVYNPNLTSQTLSLSLKKVDYTKIDTDTLFKATNAVTIDGGDYLAIKLQTGDSSYSTTNKTYSVDLKCGTNDDGVYAFLMTSTQYSNFKASPSTSADSTVSNIASGGAKVKTLKQSEALSAKQTYYYVVYNNNVLTAQTINLGITKK